MKILYTNYLPVSDGSNIHVNSFAKAMRAIGHDIRCLWHYSRRKNSTVPSHIKQQGSTLASLKKYLPEFKSILMNIKYLVKDYRHIKSGHYDIVIVRYSLNAFSAVLISKLLKTPCVIEVNSPLFYERTKMNNKTEYTDISRRIELWILKNASKAVTVSEELRLFFIKQGVCPEHIVTITNGVDRSLFYSQTKNIQLSNKLGINKNAFIIGFSGSFQKWHGILNAIDILEKLQNSSNHHNFYLLLVGDGPAKKEIESIVLKRKIKNIIFCGSVQHSLMPSYLSLFDVALAPYPRIDNFYFSPLKIFEYLAMGIPTIASRQGQIGCIIEHEKTGFLIDPDNINDYVTTILSLVKKPLYAKEIGKCAAAKASVNFGWELTAKNYINIAKRLTK